MEIHPPLGPIRSIKEFCVHLLTVVIGILIALSLDGLLEHRQHDSLRREARANLAAEIRENQQRLEQGLAAAPDAEERLKQTVEAMDTSRRNPHVPWSGLDWAFAIYPLASTAWSSAASTGAIGYMDYPEVQSYTRVYLVQDQFLAVQQRTLDRWLDLQKWSTRMNRPDARSGFTAEELLQVENAAAAALLYTQTEEAIARSLIELYAKALQPE
jgi:hypothetical protein